MGELQVKRKRIKYLIESEEPPLCITPICLTSDRFELLVPEADGVARGARDADQTSRAATSPGRGGSSVPVAEQLAASAPLMSVPRATQRRSW